MVVAEQTLETLTLVVDGYPFDLEDAVIFEWYADWAMEMTYGPDWKEWIDDLMLMHDLRAGEAVHGPLWD